jgi:hypothetical protein
MFTTGVHTASRQSTLLVGGLLVKNADDLSATRVSLKLEPAGLIEPVHHVVHLVCG